MLTERQQAVLDFIVSFIAKRSYPPSLQEIAQALAITSLQGVKDHLAALEKKGYLRRAPGRRRAIELLRPPSRVPGIPILGRIAAGPPALAAEHPEDVLPIDPATLGSGPLFALRVNGDSMRDAGILNGDYVIARRQDLAEPGAIVVALLGDDATVKYLRKRGRQWVLAPANPRYAPLPLQSQSPPVRIQGKVIAVYRALP